MYVTGVGSQPLSAGQPSRWRPGAPARSCGALTRGRFPL